MQRWGGLTSHTWSRGQRGIASRAIKLLRVTVGEIGSALVSDHCAVFYIFLTGFLRYFNFWGL